MKIFSLLYYQIILVISLSIQSYYLKDAKDIPQAKAGVILSFKQDFIDEYRESYTEKYLDYLKNMSFPAIYRNFEISVLNMNSSFYNIKINESTFNANKSIIKLHEKQPHIEIRLVEVGINVNFNYTLVSEPDLVNETGYGNLLIQDLNLTLLISPEEEKNFFSLKLHEIDIQIEDFDLKFYQGDMSGPVDYYLEVLKEYVRHHLVGIVTNETTQSIQDYLNGYLLDYPRHHTFYFQDSVGIGLDYSLLKDGVIVQDRYASILLDGTMNGFLLDKTIKNENLTQPDLGSNITRNYTLMPIHNPDREDIQVFLSEYFFNQALQTLIDSEQFKYTIENQTSDNIDAIVTQFEDSFGDHKNVSIYIQGATNSSLHKPKIEITSKSTMVEFGIEIHIRNPYNSQQDVAQIVAKMTQSVTFEIDEDLVLSGEVNELKLDVIDFIPYYVTKTQTKDINSRLAILSPILNSYINKALDDGWRIPIPQEFAQYIKKEKVTTHEGYLLIDGDVDFKTFEDSIPEKNETKQDEKEIPQNTTTDPTQNQNETKATVENDTSKNQEPATQIHFRVAKQLRNLQENHKFRTPHEKSQQGGKAHFSPQEKKESQDRFYLLVEQVYAVNQKNAESNNTTTTYKTPTDSDELITQVQDLLKGNLTENLTANWTEEMKSNSKIVQEDFKSGKLQFRDIDLSKIANIAWTSIENAVSESIQGLKGLGDVFEGEIKHDLGVLEDTGKKIGGFFGGLFGGH